MTAAVTVVTFIVCYRLLVLLRDWPGSGTSRR